MTKASRPPFSVLAIVVPVIIAGAAAIGAAVVSYARADHTTGALVSVACLFAVMVLVERFPVPVGGYGEPELLARWMCFMLSDAADFSCGSVVFVDGGSDAYFRADDWPTRVPTRRLVRYGLQFWRGSRR